MNETIGTRLKVARDKAGMYQEDAAKAMKMSRPTLSAIESSKRCVSADEVREYAELYNVSPIYLLYGNDDVAMARFQRLTEYTKRFYNLSSDQQQVILNMMEDMKEKK